MPAPNWTPSHILQIKSVINDLISGNHATNFVYTGVELLNKDRFTQETREQSSTNIGGSISPDSHDRIFITLKSDSITHTHTHTRRNFRDNLFHLKRAHTFVSEGSEVTPHEISERKQTDTT